MRRACTAVAPAKLLLLTVLWCLYHQGSLIDGGIISILDKWDWTAAWPTKYHVGVSSVSGCWRAPGIRQQMRRLCRLHFANDISAYEAISRSPGKVLRMRWGSLDAVEAVLSSSFWVLCVLFPILFPEEPAGDPNAQEAPDAEAAGDVGRRRGRAAAPPEDEEAAFQRRCRNQRRNARFLVQDRHFHMMVYISYKIKQPVRHMMHWMDREVKRHNERVRAAAATESTYLGPTPVSLFVCEQAHVIQRETRELLCNERFQADDGWAPVLRMCLSAAERGQCSQLIVELASMEAAAYDFRIMDAVDSFPLQFLYLLQTGPGVRDPRRQTIVGRLMTMEDCCLQPLQVYSRTGLSDMPLKLKKIFHDEFTVVLQCGRMPLNLFGASLLWRSALKWEGKSTEGLHVHLQMYGRVGSRSGQGLLSDQMQLKLGDRISAVECCELHPYIIETELKSSTYLGRFVQHFGEAPAELQVKVCVHQRPQLALKATGFSAPMQRIMDRGATALFTVGAALAKNSVCTGFIVSWTYFSRRSLLQATVSTTNAYGMVTLAPNFSFSSVFQEVMNLLEADEVEDGVPASAPDVPAEGSVPGAVGLGSGNVSKAPSVVADADARPNDDEIAAELVAASPEDVPAASIDAEGPDQEM